MRAEHDQDRIAIRVDALEQLPAVVWAFTGPDHVAVVANRAAREYRDGSRVHLLGRPLRETLVPENQPLIELLDEVYRTGTTRTFYETRIYVDDEERFVTFTATALRDGGTEIIGVLTYMIDVTDSVVAKRAAERDHVALQVLQERLLPAGLPVLRQLRVAARYRTAGEQLVAGGDWYDAIALGDGRLGVSIGDVVGHGPRAAAVMGQLRSVLSAALLNTGDVVEALSQLDRFVATVPAARGTTACAMIIEADSGLARFACAGHPAPVWLRAGVPARFLPAAPSAPLGMPGAAPVAGELTLAAGDSVLLYSDGAIEHPGVPTEQGRERLLAACTESSIEQRHSYQLIDRLLSGVTDRVQADDLALLVLSRRSQPVQPLLLTLPARPENLTVWRRELGRWLTGAGISEPDILAIQIACGEATTNAVEHAYGHSVAAMASGTDPQTGPETSSEATPGKVSVSAQLDDDSTVVVCVEDNGYWRDPPPNPADRGRGLLLMRQCMDQVHIHHDGPGTRVLLSRAVHAAQATVLAEPEPAIEHGCGVELRNSTAGVSAVLTGDLDAAATEATAVALRRATRGGLQQLTIDLTELSHLASTGVRLLFDIAAEQRTAGSQLAVRVAQGSAAHYVLDLTGFANLDHVRVTVQPAANQPLEPHR